MGLDAKECIKALRYEKDVQKVADSLYQMKEKFPKATDTGTTADDEEESDLVNETQEGDPEIDSNPEKQAIFNFSNDSLYATQSNFCNEMFVIQLSYISVKCPASLLCMIERFIFMLPLYYDISNFVPSNKNYYVKLFLKM